MSHKQQRDFVNGLRYFMPQFFAGKKVLEVGSLNINGSVRDFFVACDYKGIDVGPGPCVDEVVAGEDYPGPDNFYDVTCSLECFEHNPKWFETFLNMTRMTRSGGLVFFTCATTGREEHGTKDCHPSASPYTQEYYRNLTAMDFLERMNLEDRFTVFNFINEPSHFDLYFWGIKA